MEGADGRLTGERDRPTFLPGLGPSTARVAPRCDSTLGRTTGAGVPLDAHGQADPALEDDLEQAAHLDGEGVQLVGLQVSWRSVA
jgi:hypothetical protein